MDKIALSQLTPFKVNIYHFCALENRIIQTVHRIKGNVAVTLEFNYNLIEVSA